ncbi:MAG: SMI1/KNR4 family protein [Planctomycetes bacterium]|nr:SMI1/KNR4 family protein [Planctomycetota bacterium]
MPQDAGTLERLIASFPGLSAIGGADWQPVEDIKSGRTSDELAESERELGISLPDSYKRFLSISGGFSLAGGAVQFGSQHPFFHEFSAFENLTIQQRQRIAASGDPWPPPSEGMLCFAEMFMLADGDQVLFDVKQGLRDGEYSVYYYAHEDSPASVVKLASGFEEFMNGFLSYPQWG